MGTSCGAHRRLFATTAAAAGLALVAALVPARPAFADGLDTVVSFGANNLGQLGTGSAADSHTPVQVSGLTAGASGASLVVPGELHTLALTTGGSVVAWGSNYSYQLGDGDQVDQYTPVPVLGVGGTGTLSGIGCPVGAPPTCTPLAAGDNFSLALKPDGSVYAWGNNDFGQLGDGTTISKPAPVQVMSAGSGVVSLAAGSVHSLALKSDGTVLAWGGNQDGQLGNGTTNTTSDANPTPTAVTGVSGAIQVAAGSLHSLALIGPGGTIKAWGKNTFGELGDSTTNYTNSATPTTVTVLTGVSAISAGSDHNLALKAGVVYSWGANFDDTLGQPAIDAGSGFRSSVPAPVVGTTGSGTLSGVTTIAAATLGLHSLALMGTGAVVAWGFNGSGQLGDGSTANTDIPTPVIGLSGTVTEVAAGYGHSLVLQTLPGAAQNAPPAPLPFPAPAPETRPAPVVASAEAPPSNVLATQGTITDYATPNLAIDPVRPGHYAVAYTDGSISACYLSLSSDGGRTWSSRTLVGPNGDWPFQPSISDPSQTTSPNNMNGCWGPSVAYSADGNLYYEYNEINASSFAYSNLFLLASADGGVTFRVPQQLNPTEPPASNPTFNGGDQNAFSAPAIAVDTSDGPNRGQLYVAYTRSGPHFSGQIRATTCSAAALANFTSGGTLACYPSTLVDAGDRTFAFLIALPAVGSDGTVYIAWSGQTAALFSDVSNPTLIQVAASRDGGQTFGSASTVDAGYVSTLDAPSLFNAQETHLSIAGGVVPGDVYVAVGGRNEEGFARARVSTSHTYGASWASRVEIGNVTGQFNHQQHSPQVSVSPSGAIVVAYYDIAPSGMEDAWVTGSSDGGQTFTAAQRISDTSSDVSIFLQGFPPSDETVGVVATDSGYAASWIDSRRGDPVNGKTDVAFATTISPPVSPPPPTQPTPQGYWLAASDGGIFPFGSAGGHGSTGGIKLNQPIVGMAPTPDGQGYWLVAADGGVFPFGDAHGYGSTGNIRLNKPVVGMAATPDGKGYWLVASDGGIFPFGDAQGHGSTGNIRLNKPVVGMAATPDGGGYWLVASDGGIFPFGDAGGYGSTGAIRLNKPIVGMAATDDGHGYWLVASDGGIFPFGNAQGFGSTGATRLVSPIVGMSATPGGGGYWLTSAAGDVFPFGDAQNHGNTTSFKLNRPIVGIAGNPAG